MSASFCKRKEAMLLELFFGFVYKGFSETQDLSFKNRKKQDIYRQ